MLTVAKDAIIYWSRRAALVLAAIVIFGSILMVSLWNNRPALSDVNWPAATLVEAPLEMTEGTVTVIWFGVTTMLFDDGETQILIDGFISRPTVFDILLGRPVESDAAQINYVINHFRMRQLAAIIPAHSHFDHAMDVGAIANRSFASVLGSSTTGQIARGAGVPEDQIVLASSGTEYTFGNFTVTLIDSAHAPFAWRGEVPLAGQIEAPLVTPAPITAWREGHSYSIVIAHPSGTTLVQGSAGFVEGALQDVSADVVMLGTGQLEGIGRKYAEQYWQEMVTSTGAKRVYAIHFDDYTKPFGTIELMPKVLDNFVKMATWLESFRDIWDTDTQLHVPEFGQPIVLYAQPQESPDA
jgi:L-ascorbate metabolism protein UlaG (beta-lactamase superfamily)